MVAVRSRRLLDRGMKISVLVAAHQSGPQMVAALATVRAQSHTDWELVVCEYDSADETQVTVRSFAAAAQKPVHYLNLGENHGPASARNRLMELATSDWVAFLDPTDRWSPQHLENAASLLAGEADIVASDVRLVDRASGRSIGSLTVPEQLILNPTRTLFTRDALAVSSSVAFRRNVALRVGPFDARFRAQETRDFWFRCALNGKRFAATRRVTCESPRKAKPLPANGVMAAEQAVQFHEKHRDVAAVPAALRRRFLSTSLVRLGRLLLASDPTRSARCFWRAWSLQPVDIQALGRIALIGWGAQEKGAPASHITEHPPATESGGS